MNSPRNCRYCSMCGVSSKSIPSTPRYECGPLQTRNVRKSRIYYDLKSHRWRCFPTGPISTPCGQFTQPSIKHCKSRGRAGSHRPECDCNDTTDVAVIARVGHAGNLRQQASHVGWSASRTKPRGSSSRAMIERILAVCFQRFDVQKRRLPLALTAANTLFSSATSATSRSHASMCIRNMRSLSSTFSRPSNLFKCHRENQLLRIQFTSPDPPVAS